MNGEVRARLVKVLARSYEFDQLSTVVKRTLNNNLEYYVARDAMPTAVDKFLGKLEKTPEGPEGLYTFLLRLRELTRKADLRAAIGQYLGIDEEGVDIYDVLVVLEEPFVNRQTFRQKLREFFETPNRGALVVRGPRWVGKSHARWFVQHIAQQVGVEMLHIDLLENSVDDIIGLLISDMNLPPKDFMDRVQQISTRGKGVVSALRGVARNMEDQRWCLVFDGHDREEVDPGKKELVEKLLDSACKLELRPILIVLLGYSNAVPTTLRVLEDEMPPLERGDLEKFLKDFAAPYRHRLTDEHCTEMCTTILDGLTLPLDQDGMKQMNERLRRKLKDIEREGI